MLFRSLLLVGGDSYQAKLRSILNPSEDYNTQSDVGRVAVWKRGASYMFQRPILGVGVKAFPVAEGTISPLAARQNYGIGLKWSAAHNSFVEIGAELGIPGLVAFMMMLGGAVSRLERERRRLKAEQVRIRNLMVCVSAALVGFVSAGFFLSQAYYAFLYVTLAAAVAVLRLARDPTRSGDALRTASQRGQRSTGRARYPRTAQA